MGRRKPIKRPHGEIVGAAVVNRKLVCKIVERVETVAGVKTLLVLTVATFDLAVMPWGIRANQFVPDPQLSSGLLKKGWDIPFAVRETVGELKTIVGLDAFNMEAPSCVPLDQLFEEVSGRVG